MFKPIIAALIAATALVPPALAQDRHRGDRGGERSHDSGDRGNGQRQEWHQSRRDSGQQPSANRQRPAQAQAPQQAQQPQQYRGNRGQWNRGQGQQQYGGNRGQWNGNTGVVPPQARPNRGQWQQGQQARGNRSQWQGGQQYRGDRGQWQGGQQYRGDRGQWQQGQQFRGNRQFSGNRNGGNRWSGNWRRDDRYDWRNYRNSHRSNYRLPRYYAPRGYNYGYRRFGIGFTLSSILFGQQYWIEDPFYYRLPPAYGPYRWVRYYNDALLVDIETGEVVDVEYDIFW